VGLMRGMGEVVATLFGRSIGWRVGTRIHTGYFARMGVEMGRGDGHRSVMFLRLLPSFLPSLPPFLPSLLLAFPVTTVIIHPMQQRQRNDYVKPSGGRARIQGSGGAGMFRADILSTMA